MDSHFLLQGDTLILHCLIQPRASKNEFAGLQEGRLKIRLTSPPVDGKANQQLQNFISREFGVAKSHVVIIRGETGRRKTLKITEPKICPDAALIRSKA